MGTYSTVYCTVLESFSERIQYSTMQYIVCSTQYCVTGRQAINAKREANESLYPAFLIEFRFARHRVH